MRRVRPEVHDDLVDLRGVRKHRRHVLIKRNDELYWGRNRGAQQLQRLSHDMLKLDGSALLLMLPAERKDLPHQIGRAICAQKHLVEVLGDLRIL